MLSTTPQFWEAAPTNVAARTRPQERFPAGSVGKRSLASSGAFGMSGGSTRCAFRTGWPDYRSSISPETLLMPAPWIRQAAAAVSAAGTVGGCAAPLATYRHNDIHTRAASFADGTKHPQRGPPVQVPRAPPLPSLDEELQKGVLPEAPWLAHAQSFISAEDFESFNRVLAVASIGKAKASVSLSDPRQPNTPLIAVSDGFEALTGYSRRECVGKNCRFLNQGCNMPMDLRHRLRVAARTGHAFSAVLKNRKKDGSLFENLLYMSGFRIGDVVYLIGIQVDVTGTDLMKLAVHMKQLEEVEESIFAETSAAWAACHKPECNTSTSKNVMPATQAMFNSGDDAATHHQARSHFVSVQSSLARNQLVCKNTFLELDEDDELDTNIAFLRQSSSEPAFAPMVKGEGDSAESAAGKQYPSACSAGLKKVEEEAADREEQVPQGMPGTASQSPVQQMRREWDLWPKFELESSNWNPQEIVANVDAPKYDQAQNQMASQQVGLANTPFRLKNTFLEVDDDDDDDLGADIMWLRHSSSQPTLKIVSEPPVTPTRHPAEVHSRPTSSKHLPQTSYSAAPQKFNQQASVGQELMPQKISHGPAKIFPRQMEKEWDIGSKAEKDGAVANQAKMVDDARSANCNHAQNEFVSLPAGQAQDEFVPKDVPLASDDDDDDLGANIMWLRKTSSEPTLRVVSEFDGTPAKRVENLLVQAAGFTQARQSNFLCAPQASDDRPFARQEQTLQERPHGQTKSFAQRDADKTIGEECVNDQSSGKVEDPMVQELSECKPLPISSAGSISHPIGCKPCAFHCYSLTPCNRGTDCLFCHMSHPRRKGRRKHRRGKGSATSVLETDKVGDDSSVSSDERPIQQDIALRIRGTAEKPDAKFATADSITAVTQDPVRITPTCSFIGEDSEHSGGNISASFTSKAASPPVLKRDGFQVDAIPNQPCQKTSYINYEEAPAVMQPSGRGVVAPTPHTAASAPAVPPFHAQAHATRADGRSEYFEGHAANHRPRCMKSKKASAHVKPDSAYFQGHAVHHEPEFMFPETELFCGKGETEAFCPIDFIADHRRLQQIESLRLQLMLKNPLPLGC